MNTAPTALAVIPARGGSKRIPRKNIRPFGDRPMISYAIGAALESGLFQRVVVSTDDAEIAAIARAEGADVPFERPADLSDDFTPTVPVIQHAITACREDGWSGAMVCCIYPGVPFIRSSDIAEALALLENAGGAGYAFPVTHFPSPIQRALRRDAGGGVAPFAPEHVATRTQDLEPAYFDAGQFYWGSAETWLAGLNIHANGRAIVLPEWRVVDIDTPEDWDRAEALFRAIGSGSRN
ncbi:CMP-N,N'-diacetyllegionaminic acid synthase [Tsuneonella dongtanensis]|uniref:CMP-N,N'-diacetyllegionaminic acid synthase n=1 Tax=Tsuneonella dongtanensis TaxID=692370 RepID=A0A1B2A9U2_9SPHN|nr:pseudaminic acid cytidylyltransferase [Tsuneonella dongtanensis]ANY18953.1 CMP-N,N'-diacetyllegionaminic acid synthase [Tsuneonella dongtanensis]